MSASGTALSVVMVSGGAISLASEETDRPLAFWALLASLAVLLAALMVNLRGVRIVDVVDRAYIVCHRGPTRTGHHIKLPTNEDASMDAELATAEMLTSLDPLEQHPPRLLQLHAASSPTINPAPGDPPPPLEHDVEEQDDILHRARRLIDALSAADAIDSTGCSAPEPVPLDFPPEPLGVPPSHTGYVMDCIMDLQGHIDVQEVESELDGSTLLRM